MKQFAPPAGHGTAVVTARNAAPLVVAMPEPGVRRKPGALVTEPDGLAGEGGARVRLRRADNTAAEALFNSQYPRLAGVRRLVDDDETAHESRPGFYPAARPLGAAGESAQLPVHDCHESRS